MRKFHLALLLSFLISFSTWYFLIGYVVDSFNIATWIWYMKGLYILFGVWTMDLIIHNLNNK